MKKKCKRPTVGLVLSGGSVRGLSFIGVLKVFEEEKIPIDFIAGSSIGAVIGALYCSGMHPDEMAKLVLNMDWNKFMDFTSGFTGLLDGKKIEKFIRQHLVAKKFENLYTPFAAVAVDVNTGEQIVFTKGDVAEAVRASISIPGVFTPVKIGDHLLIDGSVLDPIPIDVLKGKVDKIIAIDLSISNDDYTNTKAVDGKSLTWKEFKSRFILQEIKNVKYYLRSRRVIPKFVVRLLSPNYLLKSLQGRADIPPLFKIALMANHISSNELIRLKLEKYKPDVLIRPDIKGARFIEFDKAEYLIKKGEDAARANIARIRRIICVL